MTRRKMLGAAAAALAVPVAAAEIESRHAAGSELVGRPAPPLELKHWLNSQPLEMTDLHGKIVLLRWWTDGCPYCEATAPALRKLQREYSARGLVVIGVYHPKPPGDWDMSKVERAAKEKQFTFPVAVDGDWSALKRWWLDRPRDFTSVTFLVDQKGIIRYVQPGGEFHEGNQGALPNHASCQRDFHTIDADIRRLLAA
ncbi:MAG: peroxiredoxin family protein [Bryobacteraceae bacterium]